MTRDVVSSHDFQKQLVPIDNAYRIHAGNTLSLGSQQPLLGNSNLVDDYSSTMYYSQSYRSITKRTVAFKMLHSIEHLRQKRVIQSKLKYAQYENKLK